MDDDETHAWLQGFKDRLQTDDPDALVLGEVWDATSNVSTYVNDGSLDLAFDFDLAAKMVGSVTQGGSSLVRIAQNASSASFPAGGYATFLTNHDQDRTFDMLKSGLDIRPAITDRFPFTEYEAAFEAARSGSSGKVIMDWAA